MTKPYLARTVEYFDRAAVPPEIAELLAEWPHIDPATAKLIRAAISSREPRRLRMAQTLLAGLLKVGQGGNPAPRRCR
jgi:hypothetical protein